MTIRAGCPIESALAEIRVTNRYRELQENRANGSAVDFSSNDYLGLAEDSRVTEALHEATRVGSGGSRLLAGAHREHILLEEELARWVGRERALVFSSGYHAAIGAIPVLGEALGSILSDARNHASLIDGVRLARAGRRVYAHGLVPSLTERRSRTLVVTESVFSMDGDAINPQSTLAQLGDEDMLLVDEAHALGVAGENGAGLCCGLDDNRVVVLGTFSKALGTHGGFIAGSAPIIELLVNRARSFIFDTALPPAIVEATRRALSLARQAEDRRAKLGENAIRLRKGLGSIALADNGDAAWRSPIVAVPLSTERRAIAASRLLADEGILAPAIRPPTVPAGSSRLRLSVRSMHTCAEIEHTVRAVTQCIATL